MVWGGIGLRPQGERLLVLILFPQKLRYPDWTMQAKAEMDKRKLLNMVTYLAEIEKEKGIVPKVMIDWLTEVNVLCFLGIFHGEFLRQNLWTSWEQTVYVFYPIYHPLTLFLF